MTYLKRASILIFGVSVINIGVSQAETAIEAFASMDTNIDGLVSEAEFVTYATTQEGHTLDEASQKFASIAGDDGLLSLAELQAVLPDDTSEDS